jgi:hypothetical protein
LVGEAAREEATRKPVKIILFKGFQILTFDTGLFRNGLERQALTFPLSPEKCADRRHGGKYRFSFQL